MPAASPFRLLAVLAPPDDESLGVGERELRGACRALGVRELVLLDYVDGRLDQADPRAVVAEIARAIRRLRPHVVITFGPEGGYGHPDHIAISQFATAACVLAADAARADLGAAAHAVSKLYYMEWPARVVSAYAEAFRKLTSNVDGVERDPLPWADWQITTHVDTRAHWTTVWSAVSSHESQIAAYEKLATLSPEHHESIWGTQSYYRAFSTVNGGRQPEHDVFEGLRP